MERKSFFKLLFGGIVGLFVMPKTVCGLTPIEAYRQEILNEGIYPPPKQNRLSKKDLALQYDKTIKTITEWIDRGWLPPSSAPIGCQYSITQAELNIFLEASIKM